MAKLTLFEFKLGIMFTYELRSTIEDLERELEKETDSKKKNDILKMHKLATSELLKKTNQYMDENIIFKYSCFVCGEEYESEEHLTYCDSEKCVDKDNRLNCINA